MDLDQELREKQAINAVNERLGRSFADNYSRSTVADTVKMVHHRFDGRPIRDFVPVLVERYAREELRTPRELGPSRKQPPLLSRPRQGLSWEDGAW